MAGIQRDTREIHMGVIVILKEDLGKDDLIEYLVTKAYKNGKVNLQEMTTRKNPIVIKKIDSSEVALKKKVRRSYRLSKLGRKRS